MKRSQRLLVLATSLAGATAFVGLAAPAQAQIVFDTVSWPQSPHPSSTATAIETFDALAGNADIGCLSAASLSGLNDQSVPGGGNSNIGYHEAAAFVVGATQVGTWQFRWGADFGGGGTLLVDGVELASRWSDMWWGGGFTDPSQYLSGMVNLSAGTHVVEVFGFENCCDGPGNAQFLSPDDLTWRDISTSNLTVVPLACGGANLLVTDTASPNPVNDGMTVTYNLFYESTGTVASAAATLVHQLSPSLTFVSASNGGSFDPATRKVTWSLGPLGVGVSGSVTVTATVDAEVPDQTSIMDLAQLGDGAVSATANATVVVDNAAPTLVPGMTPDPVDAGGQLTVGLTYGNGGSLDATNAVLTDVIPANTTFVSAAGGGLYDSTTRTITWLLGTIPAHGGATTSYMVTIPTPVSDHTPLTDMASLVTDHAATVSAHATAFTHSTPLLTFTDVPNANPVAAGAPLSYTLSWSNIGTDAANNSVIQWALPAHVTFQTANNGGTYDSASNKVVWNLGTILAGSSGGVTVTVLVDNPLANATQLIDQASLLTSNGGMQLVNTTVAVNSIPVLALAETGAPNPVAAGGQLVYTLTYANGGTDTAQNAVIVAGVPGNTSFVSAAGGGSYDSGANTVTFNLGALPASVNPLGTATFTVKVLSPLANGTVLSGSAMLTADNATGAPAMTTDTVQSAPTLSLTNMGMPSPIDPGSLLTYSIAYANNGSDAAHGVTITDTLPSGVTIMSASNGGTYDTGTRTVTWTLADLAVGANGVVTLTVLVNSNTPAGMLTDTAVLSASNIAGPISADALTAVNAVATGTAGSSGTGMAGASGTAGSTGTGAGGTGTGTAGSSGSGGTGVAGSSGTATGGTIGSGAGGTGTAGSSGTASGGSTGAGGSGGTGTGTAGAGGTATGGTTGTATGGTTGTTTGGTTGTTTGGTTGTATGGTTGTAGLGGTSTGGSTGIATGGTAGTATGGNGGHAMAGAAGSATGGSGGSKATGGHGGNGQAGGAGQSSAPSGGCDCAVAAAPTSGSLIWLAPLGMLLVTRRRRRR